MVKCELRVANASCLYFASYVLRVAQHYASCELRVERKLKSWKLKSAN